MEVYPVTKKTNKNPPTDRECEPAVPGYIPQWKHKKVTKYRFSKWYINISGFKCHTNDRGILTVMVKK